MPPHQTFRVQPGELGTIKIIVPRLERTQAGLTELQEKGLMLRMNDAQATRKLRLRQESEFQARLLIPVSPPSVIGTLLKLVDEFLLSNGLAADR